jgi:hypothetical protein
MAAEGHAADDVGIALGILTDHEKRGTYLVPVESVKQRRRMRRVRTIVERQTN